MRKGVVYILQYWMDAELHHISCGHIPCENMNVRQAEIRL